MTGQRAQIQWRIDAWREDDGLWTAEVYADGYGFGRQDRCASWRVAIDIAMAKANEAEART